jgi:serine/threonine protein kinase
MSILWKSITLSDYAWEREALAYIRERFPDYEPYRAWANFEFIAQDGSINEVDLLVLTPKGMFLIEIKSRPGELWGDSSIWRWENDGRRIVDDNPLLLANRKAKKLASLLKSQTAIKQSRKRLPFINTLVFLSAENLKNHLSSPARLNIHQRKDIMDVLTRLNAGERKIIDRPIAKAVSLALEEAGIKESMRLHKVGAYQLDELLAETDCYQEWRAVHSQAAGTLRKIRIYLAYGKDKDDAERLHRAARREFQLLEGIEHPAILRALEYQTHDRGPALVFEYDANAQRLDHYLAQQTSVPVDIALHLLREIAEALKAAHAHKLYHRALNPQSILILNADSSLPHCKLFNWGAAARETAQEQRSATLYLTGFVQEDGVAYLAPEARALAEADAESLDIFALGALAYHLFTGQKPAESDLELRDKLFHNHGLQITDVLNGAGKALQHLIRCATHPDKENRTVSLEEFLDHLNAAEEELTRPDNQVDNPLEARPGDLLEGGYLVKKRLGSGSTAITLLVEKAQQQWVLKIAADTDDNERLRQEAETLSKLHHEAIVRCHEVLDFNGHVALRLDYAKEDTLARRLREDGAVQLELLQRFGEDLLSAVRHLEEQGYAHRDIKPENIGLTERGKNRYLHLVLFDFSLSQVSLDNYSAGTAAYLDPFLDTPQRRRWDDYAERFSAALTLYEMLAGSLPTWAASGEHKGAELSIEAEKFEVSLRQPLEAFFRQALARDYRQRHDNAEEMLRAWRQIFEQLKQAPLVSTTEAICETVTLDTAVGLLGFSAQALEVLNRCNVNNAKDLFKLHLNELRRMTGVGSKTRREIIERVQALKSQLPSTPEADNETPQEPGFFSIDLILRRLLPEKSPDDERRRLLNAYLGNPDAPQQQSSAWPSLPEAAVQAGMKREQAQGILDKGLTLWEKKVSALTGVREEINKLLETYGGVMSAGELADVLLLRRGSTQSSPRRECWARAVTRAALEVEARKKEPRWLQRRSGHALLLAHDPDSAEYAETLGRIADDCATQTPLLSPLSAQEKLLGIEAPPDMPPLSPNRLLSLAVAVSQQAALSSRAEIYPHGMEARRALELAQGALLGARLLTVQDIQARVKGRYPLAQALPGRPQLDEWVETLGLGLKWDGEYVLSNGKCGAYHQPTKAFTTLYRSQETSLSQGGEDAPDLSLQKFQLAIDNAIQQRGFLLVSTSPRRLRDATQKLCENYPVRRVSFDELLLRHIRQVCAGMSNPPHWDKILQADAAAPDSRDWQNLQRLVQRILPNMSEELKQSAQPVLLTEPGLLARYDLVSSWLQQLRDSLSQPDGLKGLIVLTATDASGPRIDNILVPANPGGGGYVKIPGVWLGVIMK